MKSFCIEKTKYNFVFNGSVQTTIIENLSLRHTLNCFHIIYVIYDIVDYGKCKSLGIFDKYLWEELSYITTNRDVCNLCPVLYPILIRAVYFTKFKHSMNIMQYKFCIVSTHLITLVLLQFLMFRKLRKMKFY